MTSEMTVPPHTSRILLHRLQGDVLNGCRNIVPSLFLTVQTRRRVLGSSHSSEAASVILHTLTAFGVKVLAELGYILTQRRLKIYGAVDCRLKSN